VKARIWKDRETARWCFDVQGDGMRSTGERGDWAGALAAALGDMRHIASHRYRRRRRM